MAVEEAAEGATRKTMGGTAMVVGIKMGVTYWGYEGMREVTRRVNIVETRNSGTRYVKWTHIKKDGSAGKSRWSPLIRFQEWAQGIYELP